MPARIIVARHSRHVWSFRAWLAVTLGTVSTVACLDPLGAPRGRLPETSLALAEENLRVGSREWDTGLYSGSDTIISGYVLPFTLQAADTLSVFINAGTGRVVVSIYRLGWYGGAGARLITKRVVGSVRKQPPCSSPFPGPSVCAWDVTDRFVVTSQWVPGVYIAKFTDTLGHAHAYPFVVRTAHQAAFVVILPFATYEAYNAWGGANLYRSVDSTGQVSYSDRATKVSFARPFTWSAFWNHFLNVDYLLLRWLEEKSYDVSYITDYDFHLGRGASPDPVAWLFAGHSEYWSWPMWLRANAARAQGIGLGFLGGNDIYWLVRFENVSVNGFEAPVVVCYKDASKDPQGATQGLATVLFRSPPNNTPENSLVGVMTYPRAYVARAPVDLVVAHGSDPLMAGTGLTTGQHLPQVAGWEGDRVVDNGSTPAGIRVLFESPYVPVGDSVPSGLLEATVYEWPASGSLVYASGEPGFAWGLSTYGERVAWPPVQKFLANLMDAFWTAAHHR